MFKQGLKGITAVETSISHIDGEKGILWYRELLAENIASTYTFEEVSYYLMFGEFPREEEYKRFSKMLSEQRFLDEDLKHYLDYLISRQSLTSTIRSAISMLDRSEDAWPVSNEEGILLLTKIPTIVSYAYRKMQNLEPVEPSRNLGHVANFIYMLFGEEKNEFEVKALETYMILTAEHGLNASTFASRVVISTQSDIYSAVSAAIGALKGPLHGGAPAGVLEYLNEVEKSSVRKVVQEKLDKGEKVMGFGHRVYKTQDPRARALKEQLNRMNPKPDWAEFTLKTEIDTVKCLEALKPGRNLYANVEYYAASLMRAIGIPNELFTPIFCCSRMVGWIAHCKEQSENNVIFRPSAAYKK